jgi:bifunctional enzyme CysN/CysC
VLEPHSPAVSRRERVSALGHAGATVWLTGLPAAGKSTLASALERDLLEHARPAYALDGDEIRRELCRDLGFDRESRAENVRRVAHIARMLADSGVIAIVALVSPFAADRRRARELHHEADLRFIEVFLDTPVDLCQERDPKGLYAQARSGQLRGLTGAGDVYERPEHPDVHLEPGTVELSVQRVRDALSSARII